jgi:diaminopropionate ammonia-lyase
MTARLLANANAAREPYPPTLRELMNITAAKESRRTLSAWTGLREGPTPLRDMPDLARRLGVGSVLLKDESARSSLGSFKALGAPIALVKLIAKRLPVAVPADVLSGRYGSMLDGLVVISATDGNHGRALAAAARSAGVRCVIVLHGHVSLEREEAIAAFDAEMVRIDGNYDDSVREAERLARRNHWQVVSDTSYEGYEEIPRDVMQGYGTIADEVFEQLGEASDESSITHLMVQGGVGGLAAGVLSYFWEARGERRPVCVIVEPEQADCLMQSAVEGRAARATGSVDSVMAGLACGETSPLAWRFLERGADFFLTIKDADAIAAMATLAAGIGGDVPIVSGESGAAGFAGLVELCAVEDLRRQVGLGSGSRVLLVNTEGATGPALYERLVGCSAETVRASQAIWTAGSQRGHSIPSI